MPNRIADDFKALRANLQERGTLDPVGPKWLPDGDVLKLDIQVLARMTMIERSTGKRFLMDTDDKGDRCLREIE